MLARLATDTGGTFTEKNNDLSLGYARAKRAMSCVYTIGFYVDEYLEDVPRRVSIEVLRAGMRAIHPSKYVIRSPQVRRESLLTAAWNSPDTFRTGLVRAHAFPLRPVTKDAWEVLLAVRFPVPVEGTVGKESEREFGGTLRAGAKVAHRFSRKVTVRPLVETDNLEPAFTYVERAQLEPGNYELTVVMTDMRGVHHAERIVVGVPEVPRKELFVAGPTLGKQVGDDLVVYAEGEDAAGDRRAGAHGFAPLLVQYVEQPLDLIFLTDACLVGSQSAIRRAKQLSTAVRRGLTEGHTTLAEIDPVPLDLEGAGKVHCQSIVDVLPSSELPGGDFVFAATVANAADDGIDEGRVAFAVDIGPGANLPEVETDGD